MHLCFAVLCRVVVWLQGTEKRRLPGEREKHSQMRVFARYQPPGSHEGFVEGLLLESRLRLRIAELQSHRAAGRRTLADVSHSLPAVCLCLLVCDTQRVGCATRFVPVAPGPCWPVLPYTRDLTHCSCRIAADIRDAAGCVGCGWVEDSAWWS